MKQTEPDPATAERDELRAYLRSCATVSLWPLAGRALGLSRAATYNCPDIKVLRLGHRCRVPSAWLENVLFGE